MEVEEDEEDERARPLIGGYVSEEDFAQAFGVDGLHRAPRGPSSRAAFRQWHDHLQDKEVTLMAESVERQDAKIRHLKLQIRAEYIFRGSLSWREEQTVLVSKNKHKRYSLLDAQRTVYQENQLLETFYRQRRQGNHEEAQATCDLWIRTRKTRRAKYNLNHLQ